MIGTFDVIFQGFRYAQKWWTTVPKLQNHSNKGKGKEKETERGEEKKATVALSVFIMATLKIVFWA